MQLVALVYEVVVELRGGDDRLGGGKKKSVRSHLFSLPNEGRRR